MSQLEEKSQETDSRNCPECGAPLGADAPEQPCPACLMKLGLDSWASRHSDDADPGPTRLTRQQFEPPTAEELSQRLPNLEVLELLGQGGMGAVYKARQTSLDRHVALKLIRPDAADVTDFAERFAREARTLARLNHPNIVTVHDFGEVDGLYYLVMEFVEGTNLQQLIESGELAPQQVMGTPRYMAPEQMEGSHSVDHRADIYSVGLVAFVTSFDLAAGMS